MEGISVTFDSLAEDFVEDVSNEAGNSNVPSVDSRDSFATVSHRLWVVTRLQLIKHVIVRNNEYKAREEEASHNNKYLDPSAGIKRRAVS